MNSLSQDQTTTNIASVLEEQQTVSSVDFVADRMIPTSRADTLAGAIPSSPGVVPAVGEREFEEQVPHKSSAAHTMINSEITSHLGGVRAPKSAGTGLSTESQVRLVRCTFDCNLYRR